MSGEYSFSEVGSGGEGEEPGGGGGHERRRAADQGTAAGGGGQAAEDSHQEGRHKFSEENLNAQTLNFRREMYKIVDANPVA